MSITVIERIFIVTLTVITIAFIATSINCGKQIWKYSKKNQHEIARKYLMALPVCFFGIDSSIRTGSNFVISFWNSTSVILCLSHGLKIFFTGSVLIIINHAFKIKFMGE